MYRIGKEEIKEITRVIESKNLFKVNDACHETELCEKEFCEAFGTEHTLIMTSGKAALISALTALGIGPGDEVIVPAYTYIATAMAVVAVGAIPVIAEINETLTLDCKDVEKKISAHTKAIIPVHILGFPCDMDKIIEIARKYNLKIVEDACQADGGSYNGKRLGTIGDAGALSFNQFKIISAGEGGAMLTNDKSIYDKALIYHDSSAVVFFGNQMDGVNIEPFCGVEYRTNEITCAILRCQLKRLDGILNDLRKQKKYLIDKLSGKYTFAPSNDACGDCGTTLAFQFENSKDAIAFAEKAHGARPIEINKHVYNYWSPILKHYGSLNSKMDPFKMEANRGLNMNYSEDMCPKTLDILSRTVYIGIDPDLTDKEIEAEATRLIKLGDMI